MCAVHRLILCFTNSTKHQHKNRSTKHALRRKWSLYRRNIWKNVKIHQRRICHHRTLRKKAILSRNKAAFQYGLKPIVCVGETLEQREAGKAEEIITKQTQLALEGLTKAQVQNTIIAYEPIWAIGTGKTATKEDANNSIEAIRNKIVEIYGQTIASSVIIQYGGSVKSTNAKEQFEMSNIDGGLVGGSSLKAEEFSKIVNFEG